MKKQLLALTVLSALAGAASAQSNVTVYGVVDAGVAYTNNGNPAGTTWGLASGQESGSRLGFKGSEDLGGGLAAIFALENGFNTDTGTAAQGGRLFGRQAWVGLTSNSLGTVKLGRQLTPLYSALDRIDPFHINLAGNSQKVFGYGTYANDPLSRTDNTFSYATPSISGLSGIVSYGFGEQAGDTSANRNVGVGLNYANGPLNVQLVYQKANTVVSPVTLGAVTGDERAVLLGGTYDFGVVKAHLGYADNKIDGAPGNGKDRNYLVGLSAPVGAAGTVMASYVRNDVRGLDNGTSNQYAIGYTYALSKRTDLYTSYSYLKNDNDVALNTYNDGVPGANVKLFNAGIRHQF